MSENSPWEESAALELLARQARAQLELGIFATYGAALEAEAASTLTSDYKTAKVRQRIANNLRRYGRAEVPLVPRWLQTAFGTQLSVGRLNNDRPNPFGASLIPVARTKGNLTNIQLHYGFNYDQFELLNDQVDELDELGLVVPSFWPNK
jgi:hypothetical protein